MEYVEDSEVCRDRGVVTFGDVSGMGLFRGQHCCLHIVRGRRGNVPVCSGALGFLDMQEGTVRTMVKWCDG